MAVSKKRKFERKVAKAYPFVTFSTEIFEGEFSFPKLDSAPLRVIESMNTGNIEQVSQWLLEAGADKDAVEAYRDLSSEELNEQFIPAWSNGDPVGLGK